MARKAAATTNTEETVTAPVQKETAAKPVAETKITSTKKTFDASEPILCTSVTAGELILVGKKTGNVYNWSAYNDTAYVEYQDLQSLKLTKSPYVYRPLFIIENEEVVEQWADVKALYESIYNAGTMEEILELDDMSFRRTLQELPLGIKNSLKTTVYDMVENGTLDSLKKIKAIDEILGTDIMSLIRE